MRTARVFYHMARADFFERVRRYSFLLTLGFAGLLVSGVYRGQIVLTLGKYYGRPNSAWFGAFLGLVATVFLSMVGFYIVKGSLQRDEQTRVGTVLAATPLTRLAYTFGKTLSNFAVLMSMVLVLASAAVVMQLARGGGGLEWWQLLSPFLLISVPALAVIASLAVLFETIPGLRGGIGNVVYFFCFTALLASSLNLKTLDFSGISYYMESMGTAVKQIDPAYKDSFTLQLGPDKIAIKQFDWPGLQWTPRMLAERLFWVGAAILLSCLASVFFHRFDPARESRRAAHKQNSAARKRGFALSNSFPNLLGAVLPRSGALGIFTAELRLMLKGLSLWWYLVAIGLWIATLSAPLETSRQMLAAVWIWPLLLWSKMGTRETSNRTSAFIYSSPHSLQRQFPAAWMAGVVVALVTGSGVMVRLMLAHDLTGLAACLSGAFFIPTLALALGTWSNTSKTFEAIFTAWWYVGPINRVPPMDFMGTTAAGARPATYATLALLLLVVALGGRRLKLAYA